MADDKQSTSSEQCPDCQEDKMCDACAEVIGSGSSDSEEADESDDRDYDVGAPRAEIHHHYQNYHFYDFASSISIIICRQCPVTHLHPTTGLVTLHPTTGLATLHRTLITTDLNQHLASHLIRNHNLTRKGKNHSLTRKGRK